MVIGVTISGKYAQCRRHGLMLVNTRTAALAKLATGVRKGSCDVFNFDQTARFSPVKFFKNHDSPGRTSIDTLGFGPNKT
jgi:hypothetical protein